MFATAVLSAGTHVSRNRRCRAACCVLRCVRSRRSHRLRYHQLVLSAKFYFCKESKLIPFGLFTKMRCPLLFCIVVNVRYSGAFRGHTRKPQPSLLRRLLRLTFCSFPQESPPLLPSTCTLC